MKGISVSKLFSECCRKPRMMVYVTYKDLGAIAIEEAWAQYSHECGAAMMFHVIVGPQIEVGPRG